MICGFFMSEGFENEIAQMLCRREWSDNGGLMEEGAAVRKVKV